MPGEFCRPRASSDSPRITSGNCGPATCEPVDYLAIGPIFPTRSKLNPDPVVGVDRLRALRALTQKPLVAIGGITRELAPQVFEAGADSVAVISDLFPRPEEWIAICSNK